MAVTALERVILAIPLAIMFGFLLWITVFLQTYRHFPKMEQAKRLKDSILNATILTLIVIGVFLIAFYFLITTVFK